MTIIHRIPGTFALLMPIVLALMVFASCAPASGGAGGEVGEGIEVGNTSPPFAMTLEDGSEVSLKNIVDDDQPAHLFWFATW